MIRPIVSLQSITEYKLRYVITLDGYEVFGYSFESYDRRDDYNEGLTAVDDWLEMNHYHDEDVDWE